MEIGVIDRHSLDHRGGEEGCVGGNEGESLPSRAGAGADLDSDGKLNGVVAPQGVGFRKCHRPRDESRSQVDHELKTGEVSPEGGQDRYRIRGGNAPRQECTAPEFFVCFHPVTFSSNDFWRQF